MPTADINITRTVDDVPTNLAKLVAQRDSLAEALWEHEEEYADVLSDDYLDRAEAEDVTAAIAAAEAGKDPLKLPSKVDEYRALRPKVTGIQTVLAKKVREADRAVSTAYRAASASLLPKAESALGAALSEAEDALRVFLAARERVGGAAARIRHLRDVTNGGRTDAPDETATPVLPNGRPLPIDLEPLAELRMIRDSYGGGFTPDPMVLVKFGNGQRMELRESQARALHGSSNNDVRLVEAGA
jgi:hypothetical protein